ncbi:hypothetical protein Ciccas_011510, partial [Cichlidogyrus casuarinus]
LKRLRCEQVQLSDDVISLGRGADPALSSSHRQRAQWTSPSESLCSSSALAQRQQYLSTRMKHLE